MVKQLESIVAHDGLGRVDTQSSASTARRWCSTALGVRGDGPPLQRHATRDSTASLDTASLDTVGSTVQAAMRQLAITTRRVQELLELPGAMYVCVMNESTGGVLSEFSQTDTTARPSDVALRDLARHLGSLSGVAAARLEDVMMTSDSAHHLVRRYSGPGAISALVYLRLDRRRANLGLARRAIGALRYPAKSTPLDPTLTEPTTGKPVLVTPVGSSTRPASRTSVSSSVIDTSEHLSPTVAQQMRVPRVVGASGVRVVMALPPSLPRRPPAAMPLLRQDAVLRSRDVVASSSSASAAGVTISRSTVLSQSWTDDVGILNRLLEGLRKLA